MDRIAGIDQLPLVRVRYPYGAYITKAGQFQLNIGGQMEPWDSEIVPERVRTLLTYNWEAIPFGIVTQNSFESQLNIPSHTVPLRLLTQGSTFSLLSIFERQQRILIPALNSSTAGCRSLFTLPKISHQQYSQRLLRKFGVNPDHLCPKHLESQFPLLVDIANSPNFPKKWYCEILLFSRHFLERIEQNPRLKCYLLQTAWSSTAFARTEAKYDLLWSVFVNEHLPLATRNAHYVVETAKHINKVILKKVPGYVPARNNVPGPVSDLMNALANIYKVRYYLPLFMHIQNYDGINPIYYSMHYHTFFHPLPTSKTSKQTINELIKVKEIVDLFIEKMNSNQLAASLEKTELYTMLNSVEIEYFHPEASHKDIKTDISRISDEDPRFLDPIKGVIPRKDLTFPATSPFFNGCIRIRPKQ
ncbi:MAG: hypothetical protein EBX40_00725 [Gammaproteobacteria bacterium]|nr:hypothetical protein [Gammaproteobacteria bacterium]